MKTKVKAIDGAELEELNKILEVFESSERRDLGIRRNSRGDVAVNVDDYDKDMIYLTVIWNHPDEEEQENQWKLQRSILNDPKLSIKKKAEYIDN